MGLDAPRQPEKLGVRDKPEEASFEKECLQQLCHLACQEQGLHEIMHPYPYLQR